MASSLRTVFILSLGLSLLFTPTLAGIALIRDTCKYATVHRNLCFQVLLSKRESQRADAQGLAKIALKIAHDNASKLSAELVELHDKAEDMSDLQQCLEECLRQYEDAMEQLDDASVAVDTRKYREAAQWVSVAQGDVRLCQVGCKSVPEYKNMLTKQNSNVGRLCSITASILRSLAVKH
ncbi:hypothetical protein LUZ63_008785 [Rhynchospora breviuscula]|uniref:Pectinesterase inhibitor domain-containing protein n=1 Tax=Rhynchospora breviuscula TaxID=2022672 RepID=A0A9Q0CDT1_9POAL|nr:hypothetical protein LUZ63_008785 [Rhynchospora breviuscula]